MHYIEREIQPVVSSYLKQFKTLLVTGARQVGKTTMLQHTLPDGFTYISLDDLVILSSVRRDSALLFIENDLPLAIDEVQYAPELFMRIKHVVDQSDARGTIVLTGSQSYQLMQGVSESLAGRVGILEMSSLSLREVLGSLRHEPYIPHMLRGDADKPSKGFDLWHHMQRGSMPELSNPDVDSYAYYSSYVRTYIERDVRDIMKVHDEQRFYDFMVACAARTGQLLNLSDISRTIGANVGTVKDWLSVLQASGIVHILRPFWTNANKRLAKTPKIYFLDTGLACHLTGWSSAGTLRRGAMAGHMYETFVVGEIVKSYINSGRDTRDLSFYRDSQKREIDLLIRKDDVLHPVEIKANASVDADAIKNFQMLDKIAGFKKGFGSVICQTEKPCLITEDVQAVPTWTI